MPWSGICAAPGGDPPALERLGRQREDRLRNVNCSAQSESIAAQIKRVVAHVRSAKSLSHLNRKHLPSLLIPELLVLALHVPQSLS